MKQIKVLSVTLKNYLLLLIEKNLWETKLKCDDYNFFLLNIASVKKWN